MTGGDSAQDSYPDKRWAERLVSGSSGGRATSGSSADLEGAVDQLYALPLADFTQARNELAKRLRKEGRRAEASQVTALAKPSLPAWAINQLARREPRQVRQLLDAGQALREAQQAAIEGGDSSALREASNRHRAAVEELSRAARHILEASSRRPSEQVSRRVSASLRAASVDPEARVLLEAGRLTTELDPARFELFPGLRPSSAAKAAPADDEGESKRDADALQTEIRRREAVALRLRREARRLERQADGAASRAEAARAKAARAADEANERRQAAEAAKAELAAEEEALADLKATLRS